MNQQIIKDDVKYQLQNVHFNRPSKAIEASVDGKCTTGEIYMGGGIKTWIAKVYVRIA
jgi:hypothetical protein